jgi:hypothetical protein
MGDMRTPWDGFRRLARRVDALEVENAELRRRLAANEELAVAVDAPRRFDRRAMLRFGGAAAAVGAGSVLLRPDAAGATTAAMTFGSENNADATGTGLASSNGTDTLHVTNSGAGAVINANLTATNNAHAAIHALNASTDPNSSAVYGEMTDPAATGNGVVGLAFTGAGVMGSSGGSGPGVLGIAGDAQAVIAWASDNNSAPALEAEHDGNGHGVYSHLESESNASAALRGKTLGTGAGVDASSALGVGGKFSGKTAQLYLVPSATAGTHPAKGSPGQLFVDKYKRLWYCKSTSTWIQLA